MKPVLFPEIAALASQFSVSGRLCILRLRQASRQIGLSTIAGVFTGNIAQAAPR
jgi:hypothetical protein